MAKDWARLAGEQGQKVESGRLARALKLGKLATQVTGSAIKAQLSRRSEEQTAMATAAIKNARQIVDVMGQMKGAAMKVGQLLSADPDLVAPEFADHLAKLQSQSPPMEFTTVQRQIERALDRPLPDVFRYFDPQPLGSASIGQVHRATLFDGRDVAVKVQYPGVVASLDADLKNLASVLKLGRVFMTKERADGFVQEARDAILSEADYRAEGEQLARFRELFAGREGVRVPAPVLEHTRETVLVMELVEGRKLDDALADIADPEERDRLVARFVETFVFMFHDLQLLHADPHPGNFMLDTRGNVVFLDFGCVRSFDPALTDGVLQLLIAYWEGDMRKLSDLYRQLGFGREGMTMPSEAVLREYHDLILEPIRERAPFNFSEWTIHGRIRAFLRSNLEFLKLVPPPELLLYLRVLAGVKGMLTRVDARINVRAIGEACCLRRGFVPPGMG